MVIDTNSLLHRGSCEDGLAEGVKKHARSKACSSGHYVQRFLFSLLAYGHRIVGRLREIADGYQGRLFLGLRVTSRLATLSLRLGHYNHRLFF